MATASPPSTGGHIATSPHGVTRSLSTVETAFNIAVWALFTFLWGAFFVNLFVSQETLDDIWHQAHELPFLIQGAVWLLFLPLMIGLWVWEASWLFMVRLILVAGLALTTVYTFFPWKRSER